MKNNEMKTSVEPILIREDILEYKTDLHKINYWILKSHAPKIEKAFKCLNIGPLTNDFLHDILFDDLSKTKEILTSLVQKEVSTRFLKNEANKNVQSLIMVLSDVLDALNETIQRVGLLDMLEYLSVDENGKIQVSESSKLELLELHRTYVNTPEGIHRYKLHLKAVKAMNEFKKAMEPYMGIADIFDCFDIGEDDNVKVVPFDYE